LFSGQLFCGMFGAVFGRSESLGKDVLRSDVGAQADGPPF
jgi:hypothetical protein